MIEPPSAAAAVWPDWTIFKVLGDTVSIKSSPNGWWILRLRWLPTFFMLNYCNYFGGDFLIQHLVTLIGCKRFKWINSKSCRRAIFVVLRTSKKYFNKIDRPVCRPSMMPSRWCWWFVWKVQRDGGRRRMTKSVEMKPQSKPHEVHAIRNSLI